MVQKSRTEYSILNILTGLGGYALNTVIGLVCRMVFTRTLSAEYLGISGLFTNILSMLSLAELGIGSAIIYALYKPLAVGDQDKVASLVRFYGRCYKVIGIAVGAIGVMLMPFLHLLIQAPDIKESIYLIYLLYLFNSACSYFFSYRSSLIMAAQQNYIVTAANYAITIGQSILQIVWLITTREYIGYLIIQCICGWIYNFTISHIAKKKFPYIVAKNIKPLEKEERSVLIRNVYALVIWKLCGLLVNSTDNIIITYFSGLAAVGLSSNYTLLSTTLNSLLNQLFNGITASVGNLNAIGSNEKKLKIFNVIDLASFWLFGWAAIGIFVMSSDIVCLMFGESYVLPLEIPFVIALNFYMVGMQSAVWTYKNTMGLFRQGRYLLILTAAINLVCSLWLGKMWGLFGILFATAISRACTNIWYDPYAVFKYGLGVQVSTYFKKYAVYAGILVLAAGLSFYLCSFVRSSQVIKVVLKFLICCIVPNATFLLCFYRKEEFRYYKRLLSTLVNKIMSRSSR